MIPNEPDFLNYLKIEDMELTGKYGFPKVKGVRLRHPDDIKLLGFNYATNKKTENKEGQWVHFFLPDYRFQQVWNNPQRYIDCFRQYKGITSPDFSCYIGMPKAMQIFNVYRMAFLSAYYERYGIKVLPSVTWGEPDTYDWCFDWVPKRSAIVSQSKFLHGFERMLDIVKPYQVIIYGLTCREIEEMCPDFVRHNSFSQDRKETALWQQPKNWGKILQAEQAKIAKK